MLPTTLAIGHHGRLENVTVQLGDGTSFDLGRPGTRRHQRRLRKYVRTRVKHEPAFKAAFGDRYTWRGRLRDA